MTRHLSAQKCQNIDFNFQFQSPSPSLAFLSLNQQVNDIEIMKMVKCVPTSKSCDFQTLAYLKKIDIVCRKSHDVYKIQI